MREIGVQGCGHPLAASADCSIFPAWLCGLASAYKYREPPPRLPIIRLLAFSDWLLAKYPPQMLFPTRIMMGAGAFDLSRF
ncbi:MAG: hypothetical protein ACPG7F_08690 [Aggregatilineales bacterium]